mmetsp:Transcript_31524/g.100028  ORF Transcript_31524/g.100028 Transcript_31524/m.100028 type:complete len:279 (+) Transcript_31524:178-1014(+)
MLQDGDSEGPGPLELLASTLANKGLGPFFKGIEPALLRQCSYQSIRMYLYAPLRRMVSGADPDNTSMAGLIVAGGSAGAIGTLICSPTDLLKVRMQADVDGTRYKNIGDAISQIYRDDGLRGMWRGWSSNTQRAFINNAGELSGYDGTKQLLQRRYAMADGLRLHVLSSLGAGVVASVVTNPIDRAKTLLMAQSSDNAKYSNLASCLWGVIEREGVTGLWRGLPLTYLRSAPWNLLFFVSFEFYRSLLLQLRDVLKGSGKVLVNGVLMPYLARSALLV